MKRETQILLAGSPPDRAQVGFAFLDHAVKLRHRGMRDVRRKVRRHSIHVDFVPVEVIEDLVDILERYSQVGLTFPAAGSMAFQNGLPQKLNGKTEPKRAHCHAFAGTSSLFLQLTVLPVR